MKRAILVAVLAVAATGCGSSGGPGGPASPVEPSWTATEAGVTCPGATSQEQLLVQISPGYAEPEIDCTWDCAIYEGPEPTTLQAKFRMTGGVWALWSITTWAPPCSCEGSNPATCR
jgi:hypothetical protein